MSSNTVNLPISQAKDALVSGLKAANIDYKNIGSAVERTRLLNWLNAWISNGTDGLTTDKIDAAKTLFAAKEEVEQNAHTQAILERMTAMKESYTAMLDVMSSSSRGVLTMVPNPALNSMGLALEYATGSRPISQNENKDNLIKQMNMLMQQLIEQADSANKLSELITQNKDSFSNEFLSQFRATIEERKLEASLDTRLYRYKGLDVDATERLDDLMRLLKMTKDEAPLIVIGNNTSHLHEIYSQWNALSPDEKNNAQKQATKFFVNSNNGNLATLQENQKLTVIQEGVNDLDKNAQLFVQIKVRELQNAENLHKHEHDLKDLFGNLFGEGFFSKALVTAVMGFLGGSVFGSPFMGVFLTTVVSLLGSLSSSSDQSTKRAVPPEAKYDRKVSDKPTTVPA